jgi:hypothetical protein
MYCVGMSCFHLVLTLELHLCRDSKASSLSWETDLLRPLSGQQDRPNESKPKLNKRNQFPTGNLALCNNVSTVTPEKASFVDLSNSDEESNFNYSTMCNQKTQKIPISELAGCTMYSDRYMAQKCTSNYTKDGNELNVLGVKLHELTQSSFENRTVNNLKISCKLCRTQLGLSENNLVVPCTYSRMSKIYFVHMLKQGNQNMGSKNMLVETLACDISLINEELVKENKNLGIWLEEDGCVFKEVNCLFCSSGKTCLGVQVLAADASNVHLIKKVVNHLCCLSFENILCGFNY